MDFNNNKPIYLQIAAYISNKIKEETWGEQERIPSVRELGATLGVNPNTCMRAYEHLTREQIIFNSRGVGYFVSPGSKTRLMELSKKEFFEDILPAILKNLNLTSKEELIKLLHE